MRRRDDGDGTPLGLKQNNRGVEDRAGCTQPRAERCSVCGRLMLGMVPGMFRGLRLSQSADDENAEYQ